MAPTVQGQGIKSFYLKTQGHNHSSSQTRFTLLRTAVQHYHTTIYNKLTH